jgi:hypothetical protein
VNKNFKISKKLSRMLLVADCLHSDAITQQEDLIKF